MKTVQQLSLFEKIEHKHIQNIVITELKDYKAIKVKLENLKERTCKGAPDLFPSFRNISSLNELKVKQIERALKYSVDNIERRILEMKYLGPYEVNDLEVYLELGLKKGKYYSKKKSAINRFATALGII